MAALAAVAVVVFTGCSSMSAVSDGADSNLMLRGNDPVAYFNAGRATPGRREIRVEHRGFTYRFASEENRRQFITYPERYMPQFGGFCAARMVYAEPAAAGTDAFKIIDGKLYLFSGMRAKQLFEMDQERNLRLATQYWETEVRESDWRLQALKRLFFHVREYRTEAELAAEFERRFGRQPG